MLWKKVMRRELSLAEAETMVAALAQADIALHPIRGHLRAALAAACALGRPAYDCIYLRLAEQLAEPLVTADERLVGAVRATPSKRFTELVVPLTGLRQILAHERTQEP